MSLKFFHIVFVTLASVLSFVIGGWSLHRYSTHSETLYLVMGLTTVGLGLGLIVYGFWFWRKITTLDEEKKRRRRNVHPVAVMIAVWLLSDHMVQACTVCYGEAEGPMIDAARLGVYLLFGLVMALQGAFAVFFIYLRKRAREHDMQSMDPRAVETRESLEP
jgi:uncharacterized membrane protein YidH (DUF202 family)